MKLTPTAVDRLRSLLDSPEPKLIKVGVRNRGCSGLSYHLEYVDKPGKFDEMVEQDGVQVVIDSKALFSIIGSEMDWAEDKLNQRFTFRNPNIKEECGCGESFMVS
jgi:iron-sulfur cluster assembly accessory protein